MAFRRTVPLIVQTCERWRDGADPNYEHRPSEAAIEYLKQGVDETCNVLVANAGVSAQLPCRPAVQ